jgi:hypothetical protein
VDLKVEVLVNSAPSRSLWLGGGAKNGEERSGALGKRLDFPEDEREERGCQL